jgi:[ribosomal protein S5]-alanine N-acetyltransferase
MNNNQIIKSEKLILRKLTIDDISETYVRWLNNKTVNKYLESRFYKHSLRSTEDFVNAAIQDNSTYLFGIFTKDMKHIGNIKLDSINYFHKHAVIGLMIGDESSWGKGFASHSISLLSEFGFKSLKLEKIQAQCYESNIGSKKAFINAGYEIEGFFKNHVNLEGSREGVWCLGLDNLNK